MFVEMLPLTRSYNYCVILFEVCGPAIDLIIVP